MDDFTYRGFSVKKLLELCDSKFVTYGKSLPFYGLAEQYSQGKIYREYANFPEELPLNVYSDHGMDPANVVYPHELENPAYAMLTYSNHKYENFTRKRKQPCFKVPQPLIWYRNHHNIQQKENAQGTIFFAAHSTPDVSVDYDLAWICKELKALPEQMQPVGVCLFMSDVHSGTFLKYMENGFPVYTAGHVSDWNFVDRFYELISHYKYGASNAFGSFLLYCLEMGMPFSMLNQPIEFINYTDRNLKKGKIITEPLEIQVEQFFSGINLEITVQQKKYVNHLMGVTDYLSPEELHKVFEDAIKPDVLRSLGIL